ncbi:hypothetical protein T5B8_18553 [Salinisphaera sp. T5B8]|uniref:cation transporter n=1 Tax=unclassified Salinisphaera TaxID=2649847 RepID=UPI00333EE321
MNKEHRLGVSAVNLVKRHIKLASVNQTNLAQAVADIDQLYGMDSVALNQEKQCLDLAYDASRLCIDCVEKVLARHEIAIKQNWWARLKEDHYRFVDQNVKDNARHEPWNCHPAAAKPRLRK